jgi:hypothetical protein
MPLCASRNVRLRDLSHGDRCLHPRLDADLLQKVLQGKAVHHGPEHAHVISPIALHPMLLQLGAAKEIAAADNDGHLDTHLHHNGYLLGKSGDDIRIDADLATTEDLTRELQHHALVRTIHAVGFSLLCWDLFAMPALAARCAAKQRWLLRRRLESYEPQHLDPGFIELLANRHLVVDH